MIDEFKPMRVTASERRLVATLRALATMGRLDETKAPAAHVLADLVMSDLSSPNGKWLQDHGIFAPAPERKSRR